MTPHPGWLLGITVATTLARLAGAGGWTTPLGSAALLLYLAWSWHRQPVLARVMLAAAGALCLALPRLGPEPALPILDAALERATFYATFLACLGLLRLAALSSRLVRQAGALIAAQPPRRRYLSLSLGAALSGVVLNVGVLSLLGTASLRGRAPPPDRRERRMANAILRGFILVPLISPLGIALAVILSSAPAMSWTSLLPWTLSTALVLLLLGWLEDLTGNSTAAATRTAPPPDADATPLWGFAANVAGIVGLTVTVAWLTGILVPVAALYIVPIYSVLWMAVQRRRLGGGLGFRRALLSATRRTPRIFLAMRSEIAVFAGAGVIGEILVHLVPADAVLALVPASHTGGILISACAAALVAGTAQLGINPIVSVTLLAGFLPDVAALGIPVQLPAAALLAGWGLAMIGSPLTASTLVMARLCAVSSQTVSYRWNGRFVILTAIALATWFAGLATVIG